MIPYFEDYFGARPQSQQPENQENGQEDESRDCTESSPHENERNITDVISSFFRPAVVSTETPKQGSPQSAISTLTTKAATTESNLLPTETSISTPKITAVTTKDDDNIADSKFVDCYTPKDYAPLFRARTSGAKDDDSLSSTQECEQNLRKEPSQESRFDHLPPLMEDQEVDDIFWFSSLPPPRVFTDAEVFSSDRSCASASTISTVPVWDEDDCDDDSTTNHSIYRSRSLLNSDPSEWWNSGSARKLALRCASLNGWSKSYALAVLMGYYQFLTIKGSMEDWEGTELVPSIAVDKMWKEHILCDVIQYTQTTTTICGRVIGRCPSPTETTQPFYKAGTPQEKLDNEADMLKKIKTTISALHDRFEQQELNRNVWDFGQDYLGENFFDDAFDNQPPKNAPDTSCGKLLYPRQCI